MAKRQLTRKAYELFALERIRIHALRFDTIAFDLFEKLNTEFPVTGFREQYESTEKAINTLKEFMKSAHSPDKKEIIFIPDGIKIKSLEELISRFPGQQLYVDMWATWCGPCVMYFQYNEKIRPFLREHGITEIFITLDKDTVKWKTAVKYYDLQGVNMVAGGELLKDLRQKLDWDGGVPQFFIISRNGRVAVKDARTPVAEEELFKQLLDNR
jgi:thiol-disulfide isomerase/thioredoxin